MPMDTSAVLVRGGLACPSCRRVSSSSQGRQLAAKPSRRLQHRRLSRVQVSAIRSILNGEASASSVLGSASDTIQGLVAQDWDSLRSTSPEAARLFEKASLMLIPGGEGGAGQVDPIEAAKAAIFASTQTLGDQHHIITSTDTLLVSSILAGVAGCCMLVGTRFAGQDDDHTAGIPHIYDPEKLQAYWQTRPIKVAERAAILTFEIARFAAALRKDQMLGKEEQNRAKRAREIRLLVQKLGPTYIKLAQALSTRSDILPQEYISEIELLQDCVEPFSCVVAGDIVRDMLGCDPALVFEDPIRTPVAAASLGQVYRSRLTEAYGGAEVAVKVQRPGVLESVALDLYILRSLGDLTKDATSVAGRTDFMALVDDWGVRFFAEMNFQIEADNAAKFRRQMQERGLGGVVTPRTYWELSSDMLLVTEWVNGQKLSESNPEGVRELCSTLLNCYLIQLLDTGFMHADPHPGNLIVKTEGNLCLLDWGLITEVDEETRASLVEFIAHMQIEDWDRVADDLMQLGFVAPEGGSPREQGLVEPLGEILGQLTRVGGASGVNIEKVTRDLDVLSKQFPYFTIPPYFALILRAFSVIEGIAITVDPSYAIVRECMPYLAQRMLSDDSPRMRELLRQLLYGNGERLDMARLQKLGDGFVGFKTEGLSSQDETALAGANAIRRSQDFSETGLIDERIKQGLRMVLRTGGSFSQEIIINELVAAVDALGREALLELARTLTRNLPAPAFGPLGSVIFPFLAPPGGRLRRAVELSEEDQQALATVRSIMALFEEEAAEQAKSGRQGRPSRGLNLRTEDLLAIVQDPRLTVRNSIAATQDTLSLVGELAPGLANVWSQVTFRLLQRTLMRLQQTA